MKYVMFRVESAIVTRMVPVIFPELFVHADVAKRLKRLLTIGTGYKATIASAGEVRFGPHGAICSGKSETLKVESDPADGHIIDTYDYLHGIGWDKQ